MVKINNSEEALNWLINHPMQKLYDQYGNFVLYIPASNVIEHNYEIDIETATWDMDRYTQEEFIEQFKNVKFEDN